MSEEELKNWGMSVGKYPEKQEGHHIGEFEEKLKRRYLNQKVIEPRDIFLDVILEKRVRELKNKNQGESEEAAEIREWALKEVKRLKNKNEELKDKLEFVKLSNPEQNLKYFKLVDSNRRKINCLREENKKLNHKLKIANNIINELEKWLEQEYAVVKANSIQEPNNLEWYIKWNERKNILDKLQELKDRTYNNLGGINEEII